MKNGNEIKAQVTASLNTCASWVKGDVIVDDISIIDITGKTVLKQHVNNKDIDASNLTNGIYFVTFETLSGKQTEKLIKK